MPDILRAALIGFDQMLAEIKQRIAALKRHGGDIPRKRKPMSAAARARIRAAQKAQWAAYRKGRT